MKTAFWLIVFVMVTAPFGGLSAQTRDIVGKTSAEEIRTEFRVFDIYTERYQPDSTSIKFISQLQDSIEIIVMFGTWCHDSKKHLPEFMKIMEQANNPAIEVSYYGMDRDKKDPDGLSERLHLKHTPTFIIYRAGREIGRIIEEPALRFEKELVQIFKSGSRSAK